MAPEALLARLADGRAHSGAALAREFGLTRAAVWKQIGKLKTLGLDVRAFPGRGYQLAEPLDLLDAGELEAGVRECLRGRIGRVRLFMSLPSTNQYLRDCARPSPGQLDVCLAEFQTAGRGRRGRTWSAPLGAGLCLSCAWQFTETPPELTALTLAVGVAVRRVLEASAGVDVALKWPNDLIWHDRKLGGILLELNAEAHGGCHVVAGLGINVAVPDRTLAALSDWPAGATDLARATGGAVPSRTALAVALVAAFGELFASYAATGFAEYCDEWRRADYLRGRAVKLDGAGGPTFGVAAGIETDGALLVDTLGGERRRIVSGDVSVRAAT